jgi:hypothetical protein
MTQTSYYEFNKPEGTDLVNPLVDTNPNWDALDADLHEFNERSIANCTEVVSLGVHTISRLDTTAKFLKWIATANFTAGETFTVDGLPVAASTPAGASLATNAYVTGSVVLACLNADNTAMTVFVSGTTVATDSERLGGELPSYYGTASDVADNTSDITNLQNQVGNTSIVGIGDGTCTGAIDALNNELSGGLIATVTADGVKTMATLLSELYTSINSLSVSKQYSCVVVRDDTLAYRLTKKDSASFQFSNTVQPAAGTTAIGTIVIASTSGNCKVYSCNLASPSTINIAASGSEVPTSGFTLKLYA